MRRWDSNSGHLITEFIITTAEVSIVYILRELNGSHLEKSLILAKCSFCITHFKKTILEPNIAAHAWNQSTWEAKARDY